MDAARSELAYLFERAADFTLKFCHNTGLATLARVVKLVDTADLKSAAFLHKGRTGSIPVSGTNPSDWFYLFFSVLQYLIDVQAYA